MVKEVYRVGVKKNGKNTYHFIDNMETLLKFIAEECADAERVSIVKQKRFTLDSDAEE